MFENSLNIVDLLSLSSIVIFSGATLFWMRIRYLEDRNQELNEHLSSLQDSLIAADQQRQKNQFVKSWLQEAASETQSGTRFLALLRNWSTNPNSFCGWLIYNGGRFESIGTRMGPPQLSDFDNSSAKCIHLSRDFHKELFSNMPEHVKKFYIFRCGNGSFDSTILVVSELPDEWTTSADQQALRELCRFIRCQPVDAPVEVLTMSNLTEDAIVHEMLEIRSLLDQEFSTPVDMMQDILKKLAELSGYDWASLYLKGESSSASDIVQLFCSGGTLPNGCGISEWHAGEESFIHLVNEHCSQPVILTTETIVANEKQIPFRCGMLIPIHAETKHFGVLVLTHSQPTLPTNENAQLAAWASTFLVQTLDREISRATNQELARRDALTGLANRRTFDQEIQRLFQQAQNADEPLSLIMLDVDHFKSVNDRFGHQTGDVVLQRVSSTLTEITHDLRVTDYALATRYGGEEFAVLLPNVTLQGAERIAQQIRQSIEQLTISTGNQELQITASLGIATSCSRANTPTQLIAAADHVLYRAKTAGRNRVVCDHNVDHACEKIL